MFSPDRLGFHSWRFEVSQIKEEVKGLGLRFAVQGLTFNTQRRHLEKAFRQTKYQCNVANTCMDGRCCKYLS